MPRDRYKEAGVDIDIDTGAALVDRISPLARSTLRPEVVGGLGQFGALWSVGSRFRNLMFVSSTDGAGTKLKVAQTGEALIPLLAGLHELVPWLLQWHNEPSDAFGGVRLGDWFQSFLSAELRLWGRSEQDLLDWRPA